MKQIRVITIAINSSSQWKLRFLKLQAIRSWKLIQDIVTNVSKSIRRIKIDKTEALINFQCTLASTLCND